MGVCEECIHFKCKAHQYNSYFSFVLVPVPSSYFSSHRQLRNPKLTWGKNEFDHIHFTSQGEETMSDNNNDNEEEEVRPPSLL